MTATAPTIPGLKIELTGESKVNEYDLRAMSRLRAKVAVVDGCHVWTGCRNEDGYGIFRYYGAKRAHRVAYQLFVGPIPKGMMLDHVCRNRACVNPEHLEPVTPLENQVRSDASMSTFNRQKTACKNGHPFDDANTHHYRGERVCRACWKQRRESKVGKLMAAQWKAEAAS